MQASPPRHRPALRAGLLGFGVVGSGTHGVLHTNRDTAHYMGEKESRGRTIATSWRNHHSCACPRCRCTTTTVFTSQLVSWRPRITRGRRLARHRSVPHRPFSGADQNP